MSMTDTIDRISATRRPAEKAVGYHCWWNLLFVHWRVPAAEIQRLLPPQLTVMLSTVGKIFVPVSNSTKSEPTGSFAPGIRSIRWLEGLLVQSNLNSNIGPL